MILSAVIIVALTIYVRHIVHTAGKDREVDPERVKKIMRDLDYSHLDRVMNLRRKG
ncbi:hypothetical protein [Ruegeria lacuscaerulensis]|uniref:hypothetical protein n=1 Tax=Ruegeria lacuscaerulensis TaxID=55218 RepID=UPI00147DF415|nr:hypothetical protein [Ruegeria lacuscaerulensis]